MKLTLPIKLLIGVVILVVLALVVYFVTKKSPTTSSAASPAGASGAAPVVATPASTLPAKIDALNNAKSAAQNLYNALESLNTYVAGLNNTTYTTAYSVYMAGLGEPADESTLISAASANYTALCTAVNNAIGYYVMTYLTIPNCTTSTGCGYLSDLNNLVLTQSYTSTWSAVGSANVATTMVSPITTAVNALIADIQKLVTKGSALTTMGNITTWAAPLNAQITKLNTYLSNISTAEGLVTSSAAVFYSLMQVQ